MSFIGEGAEEVSGIREVREGGEQSMGVLLSPAEPWPDPGAERGLKQKWFCRIVPLEARRSLVFNINQTF